VIEKDWKAILKEVALDEQVCHFLAANLETNQAKIFAICDAGIMLQSGEGRTLWWLAS
jgi:hypothetical protein